MGLCRRKQCRLILDLLKRFQTCRGHLSSVIQKAEQTITDQASYVGKDNLQKTLMKVTPLDRARGFSPTEPWFLRCVLTNRTVVLQVCDTKKEMGSFSEQMEEMRGVCRQLNSEMKKFPDCSETPFEAEAHTLMDSWLDVRTHARTHRHTHT